MSGTGFASALLHQTEAKTALFRMFRFVIIILNAMNIIGVALRRNIIRLRANGRNIVHRQLPTLLDVTCCVRLHTLLHVVGCCCVL